MTWIGHESEGRPHAGAHGAVRLTSRGTAQKLYDALISAMRGSMMARGRRNESPARICTRVAVFAFNALYTLSRIANLVPPPAGNSSPCGGSRG